MGRLGTVMHGASTIDFVGRDQEMERVRRFLELVPTGAAGLLIEGDPGIGKTTLWKTALDEAARRSFRVLACRPAGSETRLSFGGLGDLLTEHLEPVLPELPAPQRRALEVALLLKEPEGPRPNRRAVSLAAHRVLLELAEQGPVLLAVDDVQWLDGPSAGTLAFALRRLAGSPVGIMLTRRVPHAPEVPLELDQGLPADRFDRISVGPLSVGALFHVLQSHLQSTFRRHLLVRIHQASGGNPFFALELGRALLRLDAGLAPGEALPVPTNLAALVQERLARLPKRTREVLLAAAALSHPTVSILGRVTGSAAAAAQELHRAARAGVVELHGGSVAFTHPLLASVPYGQATPERRRELHRRLAGAVSDPEERARHLALVVEGTDAKVARVLESAAEAALARGAPDSAGELAEQARNLTPPGLSGELRRRTLLAAEALYEAGDVEQAEGLLQEAVALAPAGPERGEALRRLAVVRYHRGEDFARIGDVFREALAEAKGHPGLRAAVDVNLTFVNVMVGDLPAADEHARSALRTARRLKDPTLEVAAVASVGFVDFLRGRGLDRRLLRRALELEPWGNHLPGEIRPRFLFGHILKWSGDLATGREYLEEVRRAATERGDEAALPIFLYCLSELECWAGQWDLADRYAAEGLELAVRTGLHSVRAFSLYSRALIDAHRGRVTGARANALEGLALAESYRTVPGMGLNLHVLGFLELSQGRPDAAVPHFERLRRLVDESGEVDPAPHPFRADHVEALVGSGQLDLAEEVLEELERLAELTQRPIAVAGASRSRALLLAARGDLVEAGDAARRAVEQHVEAGQPFELARARLVHGTVLRRVRRRGEAREQFQAALQTFARLGAPLWEERARAELIRATGRATPPGDLSPTEGRIAELVASGLTNREVAAILFLSVHTVDSTLKRVYRKLGVRSRAELAGRVSRRPAPRQPLPPP